MANSLNSAVFVSKREKCSLSVHKGVSMRVISFEAHTNRMLFDEWAVRKQSGGLEFLGTHVHKKFIEKKNTIIIFVSRKCHENDLFRCLDGHRIERQYLGKQYRSQFYSMAPTYSYMTRFLLTVPDLVSVTYYTIEELPMKNCFNEKLISKLAHMEWILLAEYISRARWLAPTNTAYRTMKPIQPLQQT